MGRWGEPMGRKRMVLFVQEMSTSHQHGLSTEGSCQHIDTGNTLIGGPQAEGSASIAEQVSNALWGQTMLWKNAQGRSLIFLVLVIGGAQGRGWVTPPSLPWDAIDWKPLFIWTWSSETWHMDPTYRSSQGLAAGHENLRAFNLWVLCKWESSKSTYLHLPGDSTRKTGLFWGAVAHQVTYLESGPGQGPQNKPADMSPGAPWGIRSAPHKSWEVEIKEYSKGQKWGPRYLLVPAQGTLPRWHCYSSCSQRNFENVRGGTPKRGRPWDAGPGTARVQGPYWHEGWPATSVTNGKSYKGIRGTGQLSKLSNMQLLNSRIWSEPKQSDSRACALCCKSI